MTFDQKLPFFDQSITLDNEDTVNGRRDGALSASKRLLLPGLNVGFAEQPRWE